MTINAATLLGIAPKLVDLLKVGVQHYGDLRAAGGNVTPDGIALFLSMKAGDWNPSISGKPVMDDETRAAMCRFLAGVAFNLCK